MSWASNKAREAYHFYVDDQIVHRALRAAIRETIKEAARRALLGGSGAEAAVLAMLEGDGDRGETKG